LIVIGLWSSSDDESEDVSTLKDKKLGFFTGFSFFIIYLFIYRPKTHTFTINDYQINELTNVLPKV